MQPTLCSPTDCSLPGSSVHGIFQTRILERVAISYSRDPHDRGLKPASIVPLHFRQIPPLCYLGSPGLRGCGLIQIFTLDLDQADRKQNQTSMFHSGEEPLPGSHTLLQLLQLKTQRRKHLTRNSTGFILQRGAVRIYPAPTTCCQLY